LKKRTKKLLLPGRTGVACFWPTRMKLRGCKSLLLLFFRKESLGLRPRYANFIGGVLRGRRCLRLQAAGDLVF
jgi:hypothetical protein